MPTSSLNRFLRPPGCCRKTSAIWPTWITGYKLAPRPLFRVVFLRPLGPPLTGRDATADIAPVLARATPRAQEDWPEATPRPVSQQPGGPLLPLDQPLPPLGQYLLGLAIALDTKVHRART